MSSWRVELVAKARSDIGEIDKPMRQHILDRLVWFGEHFGERYPIALHGEWKGFYKFRVGDWRIVYNYDTSAHVITVHQVDRRDKVYKKRK